MSCPTCDHTMSNLGSKPPVFICPRCGTWKRWPFVATPGAPPLADGEGEGIMPSLVQRCREFGNSLRRVADKMTTAKDLQAIEPAILDLLTEWWTLGIVESIDLPRNRKGNDNASTGK